MKSTILSVVALGLATAEAAPGWGPPGYSPPKYSPPAYSPPSYSQPAYPGQNSTCTPQQSSGWNFNSFPEGNVGSYDGFNFNGFSCVSISLSSMMKTVINNFLRLALSAKAGSAPLAPRSASLVN